MDKLMSRVQKHFHKDDNSNQQATTGQHLSAPNNLLRVSDHEFRSGPSSGDAGSGSPDFKVASVEELGDVQSLSTCVKRDLGFQGKLGDHVVLTYGDTMFSVPQGDNQFRGMTCNSCAIACNDATQVFDPILDENSYPRCLLPPDAAAGEDPSEYAVGITNIIETSHGNGILYFLLNHRPNGKDHLLGAGLATVTIDESAGYPVPKAHRLSRFWWDGETEPWYGDVCALKAEDHVYAYGHAKDNPWIYLARAPLDHATNLDAYEYWNGQDWQKERLQISTIGDKESVFWQVNQGQVIWSAYHQRYLFIFCDNFWSCSVLVRTAEKPEGPWTEPITVHKPTPIQEGGNIYAAVPHPYFDGKSMIVTYTNHPNTIQAIRVNFA